MNRSIQNLSILFLLTLASAVSAQTPVTCGIVDIDGPSIIDSDGPLVFKVKVLQTSKPEFKWSLSVGSISKGQSTDEITVDTAGLAGQEVTAKVELIGAPSGCRSSATKTVGINPPPLPSCPFDSYGDIKFENEKARLDNFVIQVFNSQGRGLIHMYAGQKTFKREAAYRLGRAKSYLIGFRGIDPSRIIAVDCGFSQELTAILYVVPPGARILECESFRQIPRSEVKFKKLRPKSSRKFR